MTSTLSITGINNTPLKSKDIVRFRIKTDMNGDIKSGGFLKFNVPAFPDLITSMNAIYSQGPTSYVTYYDANNEYRINGKYKTYPVGIGGNTTASVRLSLLSTSKPLTLSAGDTIKFTASAASTLNPLNNKEYKVLAQTTSTKVINSTSVPATSTTNGLDLLIQAGLVSSSGTVSSTINSVKEIKSRKAYYDVTARISSLNSPILNFANNDYVKDILVFGYIVSSGPPGTNARKILFKNPTVSVSSYIYITNTDGVDVVPNYSDVSDMLGKVGRTVTFEENDGIIKYDLYIYVAIARYKYIYNPTNGQQEWIGDWLQKNSDGKPIWKDVVKVTGR